MATVTQQGEFRDATVEERLFSARWTLAGLALVGLVILVSLALWGAEMGFPADVGRATGSAIDSAVEWITVEGAAVFDVISLVITRVLVFLRDVFQWIPWPAVVVGVGLLTLKMVGLRTAAFVVGSLLLMGFMGVWQSAMETLALIGTAVVISIAIAVPVGIAAARSDVLDAILRPILDGMQTLPSFVYLVPAILFFSLGNVPAVIATVIYAVPPAIRLTNLGIRQVSPDVLEAARSFGSSSQQLLVKVQIPLALPTIMAGINQTTMMALAMAVIASLVGAGGLGEDVLRALGRQEAGNSLISGLGIVVLAIIIDRVTQGFARERQEQLKARPE